MAKADLTAQRLRERLDYDRETGHLTWKLSLSNRARVGSFAGCVDKKQGGRVLVRVDDCLYLAHRLAWLHVTGNWPDGEIDHINGNPSDNRFCNLRDVATFVNAQNKKRVRVDSQTGLMGVSHDKRRGTWSSRIKVHEKKVWLGRFESPEDAHAAYLAAKRRLHEGCTI